ncbi:MAG TPA: HAD-IA family hydrolase [Steroidobacteraceae bacterium]|nr:HAD-IA family hydrolase [Steroidobacteraceae bacterium]
MITESAIDTRHPRAIIFDLLTALLDSWSVWDRAAGSEILGRRWRARYLELTYACGLYRPYEELVAEAAADAELPDTAAVTLRANWDTLTPWPEVPRVLVGLRARGLHLGVVTNCSTELGQRAATRCGIAFDAVVTAEEAGFYKPRREAYLAVLAALKVSAEDALFVAGSSADVAGAAGVGMPVVWHNRVGLPARPGSKPLREAVTLDATLEGIV